MLFEKTYGIDLGSSSVKVYSFFRNKTYIEKNMIASKGHTIIAMGNEAYDMFEKSPTDITVTSPMTFGMIANLELQDRSYPGIWRNNVFYCSSGYDCG